MVGRELNKTAFVYVNNLKISSILIWEGMTRHDACMMVADGSGLRCNDDQCLRPQAFRFLRISGGHGAINCYQIE